MLALGSPIHLAPRPAICVGVEGKNDHEAEVELRVADDVILVLLSLRVDMQQPVQGVLLLLLLLPLKARVSERKLASRVLYGSGLSGVSPACPDAQGSGCACHTG